MCIYIHKYVGLSPQPPTPRDVNAPDSLVDHEELFVKSFQERVGQEGRGRIYLYAYIKNMSRCVLYIFTYDCIYQLINNDMK
jgi:hypothetical protein